MGTVVGKRARTAVPTLFGEEPAERGPRAGRFARVALNRPVRREFSYIVPDALAADVVPGVRVSVPFGARSELGVVVGVDSETDLPPGRLRAVRAVLDAEPVLGPELVELARWIAERYACALGEALAALLPATLKRSTRARGGLFHVQAAPGVGQAELAELAERHPKQFRVLRDLLALGKPIELQDFLRRANLSSSPVRTLERRGFVKVTRAPRGADPLDVARAARPRPAQLSAAQEHAVGEITRRLDLREHASFLLQGVTGSGKTEVYLRAIEAALAHGRSAIALVPEIALTPQTVGWFRSRFGEVCVLHSRMTDEQRFHAWKRLAAGEVRVVVGARSAVFAPVRDLGVLVVDEEHEPSFKQESTPRYHAREVALERARQARAVCLLGSATPALETWTTARAGGHGHLVLPERVGGGTPPAVHVVDMRLEHERGASGPLFSRLLSAFLEETLAEREQAILFLNRRGFVPILWCPGCESSVRCKQCDLALTYHRRIDRLVCHACCDERAAPAACPTCSRPGLRPLGIGSERVEAMLRKSWPSARVARMDSDTMRRREDYEETLSAFERREIDLLVGTQMIAKGLDFPRVTLVGIVAADLGLHLPDFRASERTFQLIAQVAGRAGRSTRPGRIVVQTSAPEHPAIRHGAAARYEAFAAEELVSRRELGYPPYGRLVRVVLEDEEEPRVQAAATALAADLRAQPFAIRLQALGPAPAPVALLRGRHRRHLLLKTPLEDDLVRLAATWLAERAAAESRVQIKVDVDPMSLG
jgi:primosomal protein N' (replication factor Y)